MLAGCQDFGEDDKRLRRVSAVRRVGRFLRISQGVAFCAMGSARDGAITGSVFWGKFVASAPSVR